jgi:hypothetical protein
MMGYHDLSAAGGERVSTQDWAVREEAAQAEGLEGEAAGAAAVGGRIDPTRLRAMQRRWIQRKAGGASGMAGGGAGGGAAAIPSGGGAPLGGGVQARMEKTLGADLSGVRVHTGGESAQAAESLGARAFTVGSDVHFGRGEFAPGSKEGDRLLAHELTHVVQGQKSGVQRKADAAHADSDGGGGGEHGDHEAAGHEVSQPGDPAEQEADAMADHAADALHGGAGEHGGSANHRATEAAAGSATAAAPAAASASKKVSRKPQITAAAPDLGRKIFRASAKPPPLPADAKKTGGKAAASTAGAPASAPAKDPAEQKAEDWCATNVPKLQAFDFRTSPFSVLTLFESGLADHKKLKDNAKVKEALDLLDKKKLEVDVGGAGEVTKNVIEPIAALDAKVPGSYQAAGALAARMQRWKGYFIDASDGPKGYAAVQQALKSIQGFQAEVIKNRDAAIDALIADINGIDASDPKAMEKVEATFKHGDPWLHASGLPGGPDKLQLATIAKATKQGQIEGTLKAKQEKEKQDNDKKQQDQKMPPAASAATAPHGGAAKEHKNDAPTTASTGSSTTAAKPLPGAPVPTQPHATEAKDAKAPHAVADTTTGPHAGPDAHASVAAGTGQTHGVEEKHGAEAEHKHDPEEERKKLEEEKREVEREQLEVEIELACQQYVQNLSWANAGLGLLASLGGIAIPGLHLAGAIKSGVAAAEVVRAEYNAKWLTFAIKHLEPKEIQDCLHILSEKELSFSKLKAQIEFFLETNKGAKEATKTDWKKAHGARHVAGEAAKAEGPELAGETSGLGFHLGEEAIGHAGGEAMGAIAGELAGILPFVSVGFGIKSALAAGDKIMNLRMELIALQDQADQLGAQKGRKKI